MSAIMASFRLKQLRFLATSIASWCPLLVLFVLGREFAQLADLDLAQGACSTDATSRLHIVVNQAALVHVLHVTVVLLLDRRVLE